MEFIAITSKCKTDINAKLRCEYCGHEEIMYGYDTDEWYANIKNTKCQKCGKATVTKEVTTGVKTAITSAYKHMWETASGRMIRVEDMTDQHIKSAYKLLKQKGFISSEAMKLRMFGQKPRGDMAQLAYEQEFDEMLASPTTHFLDYFEEEAGKRELELE